MQHMRDKISTKEIKIKTRKHACLWDCRMLTFMYTKISSAAKNQGKGFLTLQTDNNLSGG